MSLSLTKLTKVNKMPNQDLQLIICGDLCTCFKHPNYSSQHHRENYLCIHGITPRIVSPGDLCHYNLTMAQRSPKSTEITETLKSLAEGKEQIVSLRSRLSKAKSLV